MRPLELALSGFTCFRDEQVVSFRELDLFAIAGPTGAGKTTLLDAIVYALYGQIPRLGGARGFKEFISLGHGRMDARLDFEVGEQRFRVARYTRRSGNGGAMLEQLEGDATRPLCDGVRDVTARIESVLGMGAAAFLQSVVLPQGKFADFLHSKPADRRKILTELLRLGVYEQMRKTSQAAAAKLSTALEHERRRLEEDYADASDASLAALAAQESSLAGDLAARASAREAAQDALRDARERRRLTSARQSAEAELATLEARATEVETRREELGAAGRAARVTPAAEALRRAERRRAEVDADRERRHAEHAEVERALAEAERALAEARRRANGLADLRARERELERVAGELPHAARRREAVEALSARLSEIRRREAEQARALEAGRAAQRAAEATVGAVEAELAALAHDPAALSALRGASADTARLRVELERLAALAHEVTGAEAALAEAGATARARAREVEAALATEREAAAAASRARAAHEAARREHAALDLRGQLVAGAACPVCEQDVAQVPAARAHPEVERLEAELAEADEASARARAAREAAATADAVAREAAERAAATLGERVGAREALQRSASERARVVAAALGEPDPPGDPEDATTLPDRFEATLAAEEQRASHVAEAQASLAKARTEQATARGKVAAAETAAADLAEQARTREGELADATAELDAVVARIRSVTDADDPAEEHRAVAAEVRALEGALEVATAAHAGAADRRAASAQALEGVEAAAAEVARGLAQSRAELAAAVQREGFADVDAALAAARPADAVAALEADVTAWERDRHAARARLAELEAELGARAIGPEALEAAETAAREATARHEEASEALGQVRERLRALREDVARARQLREEHAAHVAAHRLHDELARELKSDRFQDYLLRETFRELVRDASERLMALSGRYTLRMQEDAFYVVDHDNARELRHADTLSGGETFLASLALALELSEQIQRAAGAVRLDSLFIDEGFGTLDPETLDTVAATLEALTTGERMVGLITHVKALTDRMPARLRVTKEPTGSRVTVEVP